MTSEITLSTPEGVELVGVTADTPCFVVAYHPDRTERTARGEAKETIVRWFGQALPKGFRPAGIVTAGSEIKMAVWTGLTDEQIAMRLGLTLFGRFELDGDGPMRALFDEPVDVLREAIIWGTIGQMPQLRAVTLLRTHLDELTDEEILAALPQLTPAVKAPLFIGTDEARQRRLYHLVKRSATHTTED